MSLEGPSIIRVTATIDGHEPRVLSLRLEQALSRVGQARVELEEVPAELLGRELCVAIERDDGASRASFAGTIVEVERVAGDTPAPLTRIVAVPRLWRLSKRSDCRVFQRMTTMQIAGDVLDRAGVAHEWRLTGSYQPREYCVQHRETDHAFVMRLLSEDGISFAVEDDTVRFFEGDLGPVEGATELRYAAEFGFDTGRDSVERLELASRVASDKVTLRDYDFERPDFELRAEHLGEGDGPKALETYVFPARSNDETVTSHYARALLDELRCRRELIAGESQTQHLAPGRTFSISGHPYEALNREYLVTTVEHRYRAPGWGGVERGEQGCRFEAMPLDRGPWRPPRLDRARRVPGYDSAVVVGPAGSEILPDEYGRVKAQPIWDREGDGTDAASTWMRTVQLPLGGGLYTPRVGWEVTLQNLEGDPDRPVVTGRMYTGKAPPPYPLPEHKSRMAIQTHTSPGGGSVNELRIDDKKGAEQLHLNASKDMKVGAGNNATETIGGNETRQIGSNQKLDVTGAKESVSGTQSWQVGGNESVSTGTYMVDKNGGAHSLSIGGNRDLKIGGDHRALVGGASKLEVGGIHVDLVAGSVTDSTTSTMDDSIGSVYVDIAGGGHSVAVGGSRVEKVGALKAVLATGKRAVEVGGAMTHDVTGVLALQPKSELKDNSKGALTVVAGGAQLVKADEVTFTAKSALTVICGGSTLTLTPGSVTLAGATIKIDGVAPEDAALIKDN